jgi:hypothetical protein
MAIVLFALPSSPNTSLALDMVRENTILVMYGFLCKSHRKVIVYRKNLHPVQVS